MRRFSQRNSLVTLSDINITPLLDLAFVLLIIFVIISPSIRSAHEQSIRLNLPKGGQPERKVEAKDVVTVELNPQGQIYFNGKPIHLKQLEVELNRKADANPNLVVAFRADRKSLYDSFYGVIDICQNHKPPIFCSLKGEAKTTK